MNTELNIVNEVEPITSELTSYFISFPVEVTLISEDDNYDTVASIDEGGNLIITPSSPTTKFISAATQWELNQSINADQKCEIQELDNGLKQNNCVIKCEADLLKGASLIRITSEIDSLGQLLLIPNKDNSFISLSVNNSLNLITEEQEDNDIDDYSDDSTDESNFPSNTKKEDNVVDEINQAIEDKEIKTSLQESTSDGVDLVIDDIEHLLIQLQQKLDDLRNHNK